MPRNKSTQRNSVSVLLLEAPTALPLSLRISSSRDNTEVCQRPSYLRPVMRPNLLSMQQNQTTDSER
jgi:hypothetical protein